MHWYKKNRRDLPWRRTRDPYAIWVAETMLQQTQVNTVLPYYQRFLRAFPTINALDRARKERVLALWSGLGYYRRAENLKKAARMILRRHRGKIPQDFDALRALPGVGPYTAGALMSIAFRKPYPAIDGNAQRVLSRLFNVTRQKDLTEVGRRLVPPSQPGRFNQALMELGSKICLHREPQCSLCPISRHCAAQRLGRFAIQRASLRKRRIKNTEWPLLVIETNGKILLRRRASGGLLSGLWEVPGGERNRGETLQSALDRHLDGLGGRVSSGSFIGEIHHSITHHSIRAPVFLCADRTKIGLPHRGWRWFSPSSLHRYPLSSLSLKAVRLVTER